jgi:hypothetical protein
MDRKELVRHCKVFEQGYEGVGQLIYDWGIENKSLKKTWKAVLAQEKEGKSPPLFYEASAFNYLLSHGLTDTKVLKRIQNEQELFMLPKEKQVLAHLVGHPAFWCFFTVKKAHEDDLFTIKDLLSGETHQLYSPRLPSLRKDPRIRGKHFLTLVYSNGECLHCAGILRFNALSASDLNFYCSLFDRGQPLGPVIKAHYLQFFKLDTISFVPQQKQGGQTLKQLWQPFTLEEFDITDLGGRWETVEVGPQIKYNLLEPDQSMRSLPNGELLFSDFLMMEGLLVRDLKTGAMGVSTGTDAAYAFHVALLMRSYPNLCLPSKPAVSISLPLAVLLMDMDLEVPWSHFKKILHTPTASSRELLYGKDPK